MLIPQNAKRPQSGLKSVVSTKSLRVLFTLPMRCVPDRNARTVFGIFKLCCRKT